MSNAAQTVKTFLSSVFDDGGVHVDRIDQHFHPDFVFHDAQPGFEGVQGYKALMTMFQSATRTVTGATQPLIVADGDLVSVRWENERSDAAG